MKKFSSKTQKIGEIGEKLAKTFLMKQGFTIIETNYTRKFGEIDIVAKKSNILHFIEVKSISYTVNTLDRGSGHVTRETSSGIRPEENMHEKKLARFLKTVEYYVMAKNINKDYQIDLALVYIDHIKRVGGVKLMENIV